MTTDVGWRELGWGMIIAGTILTVISVLVDATTGIVTSVGILAGGVVAVAYAMTHPRTRQQLTDAPDGS